MVKVLLFVPKVWDEAAPLGDVFVTVTGCKDVITRQHFEKMKDGAICCNAGHFDVEINLVQLADMATDRKELRKNIEGFVMPDGRTICILAEGRLVNLASGDGHPVEIMDMSFALQAQSARYIAEHGKELDKKVYDTPTVIDDRVGEFLLQSKGYSIDKLTPEQDAYIHSWNLEE